MRVFDDKQDNVFKLLSEAISEGIVIVNKKQEIIASNEAANIMFGYENDELEGKSLNVLIPKNYHKNHRDHFSGFMNHFETRQMGHGREIFGLRKDGTKFPVEAGLNPFDVYGEKFVMALVSDITIRKNHENQIKDLNEKKAANYRNQFLGFVFQSFNLINYKNAMENVALPLYYQGLKRKERQEKAMFHLEKVGLAEWAKHLPSELSGGQKQRVAIARALASEPKLLLADEPTGALDTATSHDIMQFLQQLNDEGKTILLVTHEEDIAKMCKRIVRLRDGVIIEDNIISNKVSFLVISIRSLFLFIHFSFVIIFNPEVCSNSNYNPT